MQDLERLLYCIDDGKAIESLKTEEELREFFICSKTNIRQVFGMTAEDVLNRWPATEDRMAKVRAYLLWDFIAYNIAEMYEAYDSAREGSS